MIVRQLKKDKKDLCKNLAPLAANLINTVMTQAPSTSMPLTAGL
jgi:hypothetical protein